MSNWKSPRCSQACWGEIRRHEAERDALVKRLVAGKIMDQAGWLIDTQKDIIAAEAALASPPPAQTGGKKAMTDDELETHSIKWNVARIVRLSSGRFALLTHYRAGALDLIKVGTIEEIADFIPTAEQCIPDRAESTTKAKLKLDLADLGL